MKLTIFAATGGIGRQLLDQATGAGHDVTAVARNPQSLADAAARAVAVGTVPSPQRPNPPRHDPGDGIIIRYLADPIVKRALRDHYADLARMEDVLRASDLDWTIVRPPRLTDKPVTGRYRTAYGQNLRRGVFVSRADVAHYMLSVLDNPETFHQTVGIAN